MNLNEGLLAYLFPEVTSWYLHTWYVLLPAVLLVLAAAYLLGSINPAILISRIFFHEDVRTKGSGNAGTTNMLRNYGKGAALMTVAGDVLKTVLSIFIAGFVFGFNYAATPIGPLSVSEMCYAAALFSVLGHIFPAYFKFRGGKGVLSTITTMLMLSPTVALVLLTIYVVVIAIFKFVSLGSVIMLSLYPIVLNAVFQIFTRNEDGDWYRMPVLIAITTIALAILIVWCHRTNLARISRGEENKLSFKKKPKVPPEAAEDVGGESADVSSDDNGAADATEDSADGDGAADEEE